MLDSAVSSEDFEILCSFYPDFDCDDFLDYLKLFQKDYCVSVSLFNLLQNRKLLGTALSYYSSFENYLNTRLDIYECTPSGDAAFSIAEFLYPSVFLDCCCKDVSIFLQEYKNFVPSNLCQNHLVLKIDSQKPLVLKIDS